MLNKEKYAKEIIEIACNGYSLGKHKNGELCSCDSVKCSQCEFHKEGENCATILQKWANSEYEEHEIDWSKVPVDTPIYVWTDWCDIREKRYFAKYENNTIYAFADGNTSWSNDDDSVKWDNAKIREDIDCSEWYKD